MTTEEVSHGDILVMQMQVINHVCQQDGLSGAQLSRIYQRARYACESWVLPGSVLWTPTEKTRSPRFPGLFPDNLMVKVGTKVEDL